jgi:hypothetical protein
MQMLALDWSSASQKHRRYLRKIHASYLPKLRRGVLSLQNPGVSLVTLFDAYFGLLTALYRVIQAAWLLWRTDDRAGTGCNAIA